jgi:hypothetical protein
MHRAPTYAFEPGAGARLTPAQAIGRLAFRHWSRTMRSRTATALLCSITVALGAIVLAADDECGPPRCRGLAPVFLTEEIAPLQLGRDAILPVKIRGTNEGSYFSFTGLPPKTERVRSIHLELEHEKLTKDAVRELQQRISITFGMCAVSETTTTCQVTIRGKALGPVFVPIKAVDQCLRNDCPAPSGREKFSYTIRTFSTKVVD